MKNLLHPHRATGQFARFALSGGFSALADFSTYTLLVRGLSWDPLVANLISRPFGGLVSFTLNKFWTFRRRERAGTRSQFLKFWIVWIVSFCNSEFLIWVFHDLLAWGPILAKVFAEAIAALVTFTLHKFWTFR